MKKKVLRALALCLTTVLVTAHAAAQDETTKSSSATSGANASGTSGTGSSTTSSLGSTNSSMGQPVRLSKLMRQSLRGQSGQALGTVQDVIIDPSSGQVQFVVLSLSGSSAAGSPGSSSSSTSGLGSTSSSSASSRSGSTSSSGIGSTSSSMSGNLVAIPWSLVQHSGADQFSVNVDQSKLQSAPTFSASSWPSMDTSWSQQVNSHFGVTGTGAPGSSSGISTPGNGSGLSNPSTPGVPPTPGTPDINSPSSTPGSIGTPSTLPTPGTPSTSTAPGANSSGIGVGGSTGSSGAPGSGTGGGSGK